jgi:hypothetical protein
MRQRQLGLSAIMRILVSYQRQQHRMFKVYYGQQVCVDWRSPWPHH